MLTANFEEPQVSHKLTFLEVNILLENLRILRNEKPEDKAGCIERLVNLIQNTTDTYLLRELKQLKSKVMDLSEDEFELLRQDVQSGKVMSEPNYTLPRLTSQS